MHTAVKIDPNYRSGPVVHVNDASRAVGVASSLLSPEKREAYAADVRAEYAKISAAHFRAQADKKRLKLAAARANAVKIDFAAKPPKKPTFLGVKSFDAYDLAELADYIDWTPFFQTWELAGRFPAILNDAKVGEAARALYDDARKMLDRIVKEKWFTARAVIGFWPAAASGDDIVLYADDTRKKKIATLHTLRQQLEKREGRFNAALSDFIAPVSSGVPDYIGGFAVTAGIGEDVIADRFKHANDDYSSILCKALADRLAEAFAERMHARVRREFWAYAPDETLAPDDLILEKYQGIRPAPGYPAQPDHTEKKTLFELLDAEKNAGVTLTESFAMWPGSSVSGLYFSNAESFYFGVGKIERDQVEDYAARKGMSVAEIERWLAPILNYIPAQDQSAQERAVKEAMPKAVPAASPANDISRICLASAGLHLRGASGVAEEGRGGEVSFPVVPAKAGTHTPRSRDGVRRATFFATTKACGYGSRPAPGRHRVGFSDSTLKQPRRCAPAFPRHDVCELCVLRDPHEIRGRRECRMLVAPAGSCAG